MNSEKAFKYLATSSLLSGQVSSAGRYVLLQGTSLLLQYFAFIHYMLYQREERFAQSSFLSTVPWCLPLWALSSLFRWLHLESSRILYFVHSRLGLLLWRVYLPPRSPRSRSAPSPTRSESTNFAWWGVVPCFLFPQEAVRRIVFSNANVTLLPVYIATILLPRSSRFRSSSDLRIATCSAWLLEQQVWSL